MRSLHFCGSAWGIVMESCAVSRYPSPVLPPTSMKEANRENRTLICDWYRVQILIMVFMASLGVWICSAEHF